MGVTPSYSHYDALMSPCPHLDYMGIILPLWSLHTRGHHPIPWLPRTKWCHSLCTPHPQHVHLIPVVTTYMSVTLAPYTQMSLYSHGHHIHTDITVPRVPALTWTSLCPCGHYIDMSVPLSSWIQTYGHQFVPRIPALTRTSHCPHGPCTSMDIILSPQPLHSLCPHGLYRYTDVTFSPGSQHSPGHRTIQRFGLDGTLMII